MVRLPQSSSDQQERGASLCYPRAGGGTADAHGSGPCVPQGREGSNPSSPTRRLMLLGKLCLPSPWPAIPIRGAEPPGPPRTGVLFVLLVAVRLSFALGFHRRRFDGALYDSD